MKTVTIGGTEKWPKEGGGTTGLTVSKTRHRHQPRTSHRLQETSQARFLHLDKPKASLEKGRVYEKEPTSSPEGEENRQPSIPARKSATASPQASETAVNQSGRKNHTEAPPMKERPEVGGRNTWSRTSNRGRPLEPPDRREEATGEGDCHLSHVSPVEPTTGRATPTPTREEVT